MDTLILVDVLDSHGKLISRQRLPLACPGTPLVIGRDVACDIIVNDPYAAARHAELSLHEDGSVRVTGLDTINGLILQGERVRRVTAVGLQDGEVQVGHSHLRIRSALETLAPERPDLESLRSRHREYGVSALGALLCIVFGGFAAWIGSPDNEPLAVAANLALGSLVLGAWFGFWIVLGRSVRSRWQWWANAAITLGAAAAILWLRWATGVAEFATGLHWLGRLGEGVLVLIAGLALYLHLRTATRLKWPRAAMLACAIPALGFSGWLWFLDQEHAEDVNYIPAPAVIYPPSWLRQPGMSRDKFLAEALELRDLADQRRAEAQSYEYGD